MCSCKHRRPGCAGCCTSIQADRLLSDLPSDAPTLLAHKGTAGCELQSASDRSRRPQPQPPHRPLLLLLPSLPLQNQTTRPFRHEDALLAPHEPVTAPGARPDSQRQGSRDPGRAISGSRAARGHRPLPTAMAPAQAQPDPQNGCSLHSLLKFILNAVPQDHF